MSVSTYDEVADTAVVFPDAFRVGTAIRTNLMLARAAVGTRSGFARCGRRCRSARADGKPRRFRAAVVSASTSFSDDIRGFDRTATSSGSGVGDRTATSPSRGGSGAPAGVTVSVPHLTALLLDLNAEGRRIIRGVVDRGDLGLVNKNDVGVVGDFSRDVKKPQTPRTTSSFLYEYDPEIDAQTEADRRVEAHVLRALRAFCPELTVVAEESYENPDAAIPESDDFADLPNDVAATVAPFPASPKKGHAGAHAPVTNEARAALAGGLDWPPHLLEPVDASRVTVFVDPLDGTNEFAAGARECVTCLMGVAVDGSPVVGIIGQPFFCSRDETNANDANANDAFFQRAGRVVWGGRGIGVIGVETEASAKSFPSVEGLNKTRMVCAVNRATRDVRVDKAIARLNLDARFKVSATGFHFLTLLEGKADCALLLREGTKKWDSCPGEALLRARGGCVTDAAGRLYDYGDKEMALNLSGLVSSRDARTHARLVDAAVAVARETAAEEDRTPRSTPSLSRSLHFPLNVHGLSVRPPVLPPAPAGGWQALTVDVGGCLLTPKERVVETYVRLARSLGLDARRANEDSVMRAIRDGFSKPIPPGNPPGVRYVGDGKAFWRPLVRQAMQGDIEVTKLPPLDDEIVENALDALYAHYEKPSSWHVAPRSVESLRLLRENGVAVAVVSNWDTRLPSLLRTCGFDETVLDTVVCSAEVLADKPDRGIFDVALERLRLKNAFHDDSPSRVVHVGDSSVNDVDGASIAGFGGAMLWNSAPRNGCVFDFQELAMEILESRRAR
jgi:3'(2'), 5'-bisphosphate nucleotidase